jgi:hypothetical protein
MASFDLPSGGSYEVTVRAFDNAWRSSDTSEPVAVTVPPADDWSPPSAPTNLRATFNANVPTLVQWDAATGGSGMVLYDVIIVEYDTNIETTANLEIELGDFGECEPGDPQPLTFVVTATSQGFVSPPSNPITLCFN